MADLKTADIRAMSPDQMDDAVLNLKKERFNLRFQRATGQLENTSRMREARRPRLDPRLPGRSGVEEAGRSAHGLRQGYA